MARAFRHNYALQGLIIKLATFYVIFHLKTNDFKLMVYYASFRFG